MYTHTHTFTHTHTYIYICIYIYMHVYVCIYTYIHTFTHTHTHIYICVCMCVYIHTPIHSHTHTYIYIHTHTLVWVWASLVVQTVEHLPAVWETRVWSLGWEDPLEKEMAPHSSTLAWKIPWTEEPGSLSPWGPKESDTTEQLHFHFHNLHICVYVGSN